MSVANGIVECLRQRLLLHCEWLTTIFGHQRIQCATGERRRLSKRRKHLEVVRFRMDEQTTGSIRADSSLGVFFTWASLVLGVYWQRHTETGLFAVYFHTDEFIRGVSEFLKAVCKSAIFAKIALGLLQPVLTHHRLVAFFISPVMLMHTLVVGHQNSRCLALIV